MANKRIIYKDNIIIEFGSNSYHAFVINQDNDVEDKAFTTLESAKQWIDNMGYRLHCATKYEVEYSGGRFNHKCEEFHDLLQACDATYTGESCDNEFEVTKTEWKKAIDNLRNLDNLEEEEQENIKNALKWMTDSREEIIEDMEYLLSKADPSHDFLHLSFY